MQWEAARILQIEGIAHPARTKWKSNNAQAVETINVLHIFRIYLFPSICTVWVWMFLLLFLFIMFFFLSPYYIVYVRCWQTAFATSSTVVYKLRAMCVLSPCYDDIRLRCFEWVYGFILFTLSQFSLQAAIGVCFYCCRSNVLPARKSSRLVVWRFCCVVILPLLPLYPSITSFDARRPKCRTTQLAATMKQSTPAYEQIDSV